MTTTAPFEIKISIPTAVIENALDTGFDQLHYWGDVVDLKYPSGAPEMPNNADGYPPMTKATWCAVHAGGTVTILEYDPQTPDVLDEHVYEVRTYDGDGFVTTRGDLARDFTFPADDFARIDALVAEEQTAIGNEDVGEYSITRVAGRLHKLDRAALDRGLLVLASSHAQHFGQIVCDDADSDSGDMLIQAAIFGELVYG